MSLLEIVASVIGFVASIMLFVPGWKASEYLKLIHELRLASEREKAAGSTQNRAEKLAGILEEHTASWSQREHRLLFWGFILLCVSFFLSFCSALVEAFS